MKNALTLLALSAVICVQATDFVRLTDFSKLETGDEVVITMTYDSVVYALNGDDSKSANPKSDTIYKIPQDGDTLRTWADPDAKYVYKVNKYQDSVTFTRADGYMLYQVSSGIRVNTEVQAKKNSYYWHVKNNYLYSIIKSDSLYIGVYHRNGDSYANKNLKVFEHYKQSQNHQYINNETLAFYVNSPTGDPNKKKDTIKVDNVEGGSISVSYPIAGKDTRIEVNIEVEKGYDYVDGSLRYIFNDGTQDITMLIDDDQFIMPGYPVLVTAEFEGRTPKATIDFTNTANEWSIPTKHTFAENSYSNNGYTIVIHPTGTDKDDKSGYNWGNSSGGYVRLGQKNAYLQLPAFDFDVNKIVVTGKKYASTQTAMNIMVSDSAVSKQTIGSTDENIYVIPYRCADARVAGTLYKVTILNAYPAQFATIDIYGTLPNAPEPPEVTVPAGLYKEPQNVKLMCYTEGAKIYYTLNGSRPTEASMLYANNTFVVDHNMTIRAIAIKDGVKSEILTAAYAIANVSTEGTLENPYTVADVQKLGNPGYRAWVHGYIINGFDPNIKTRRLTNESMNALAIADNVLETDTTKMAFVELPQGKVRDSLNVVNHITNIGKEVWVYGILSKYGLQPGVTKTSKFYLDKLPEVPTDIQMPLNDEKSKAKKYLIDGQLYIELDGKLFLPTGQQL